MDLIVENSSPINADSDVTSRSNERLEAAQTTVYLTSYSLGHTAHKTKNGRRVVVVYMDVPDNGLTETSP